LGGQADSFISNSTSQRTPFFAYVAPIAPHDPSTPAPRDAHDYDGISGPPSELVSRLQALKSCAENSCRTVEGGP
jgi:hypothetical protein